MWFTYDVPPNPLIQTVIQQEEEAPEQTPPPQQEPVTWKDNPQGCNEDIEYIAAESPYYCIPKTQAVTNTTSTQKPVRQAYRASSGWFPAGQCTWWVASKRPVGMWNNASDWLWQAQRDGYATGSQARPGAVAWKYGHVAYVESVSGNQMTISEANYDYRGSVRTITVPVSSYTAFIY